MSVASPVPTAEIAYSSTTGILRRVFSFPVMLMCLLTVLGTLTVRGRFDDPDMWWHLKIGQIIWNTHSIPLTDIFSYTTHHHSWIPHEWLAQVTIYIGYLCGGYTGLMLWLIGMTAALLIAGYCLCALYSGNAKVAFIGALTVWIFATSGLAVRPQVIGYLLLILELLAIHLARSHHPRWFLALPPLFAVWINCHGSFFLGLLVAAIFLLSSFVDFRLGPLVSIAWDRNSRRLLLIALPLSVAALFLNPAGIQQVLYPVDTLFHQPVNLAAVDEWNTLSFTSERGVALLFVLACIAFLTLSRKSQIFLHELLLLVVAAQMAISHERMTFVFGILAAPVLTRQLSKLWEGYDPAQDRFVPNAILIALSILVTYFAIPGIDNLRSQASEGSPVKAVDYIQTHHLSGPMLNDYSYGGYLIWAAPEYPVFLDGRGDVFEWSGILTEFGNWATRKSNPYTLLQKYKIGFVLLSTQSPMATVMPTLRGWKLVYSDNNSVVFTPAAK